MAAGLHAQSYMEYRQSCFLLQDSAVQMATVHTGCVDGDRDGGVGGSGVSVRPLCGLEQLNITQQFCGVIIMNTTSPHKNK